jgi:Phosphotransferase enzyme family
VQRVTRTVTLVLADDSGVLRGALPPFEVPSPWWPEVSDVVDGARQRYGVEVTVLRLVASERPAPHGGAVTYLAECPRVPTEVRLEPAEIDIADHPLRAAWARPGGPAASVAWAAGRLAELGWEPAAAVQQRTWNLSAIWRLDSPSGVAWLKQVPPFFAHEPTVLRWPSATAPRSAPAVLAADAASGRMLLGDVPGEDRHHAPVAELGALVDDLHGLQRAATAQVDDLLAAGVPDGRWPVLGRAIRDTVARYGPDLGAETDARLRSLVDGLDERCAAIDACGLPDTLVHGDFHPGNTRGDGTRRTLLDWGDSFVGHPAFDALRLVDQQPPADAAELLRHWSQRWRASVPGCDPAGALELMAPMAALRNAVVYADFVDAIEPSERAYHAADIGIQLRAAADA